MQIIKFIWTFLLAVILVFTSYGQIYNENFVDGKIYIKLVEQENFKQNTNQPKYQIENFPFLNILSQEYEITTIKAPFYRLDAPKLKYTYELQFYAYDKVDELIRELEKSPQIEYAEKLPLYRISVTPNDPLFNDNLLYHLQKIEAEGAWDITTGDSNIVVAVIDNAMDIDHPDLQANIYKNPKEIPNDNADNDFNGLIDDYQGYDFGDNDNDPRPDFTSSGNLDLKSHGTHVSGLASATTNNGLGLASIGFNLKIMPLKATSSFVPSGAELSIENPFECIAYAVEQQADVINMSYGSYSSSITERNLLNFAYDQGTILVGAAGNDGVAIPFYPCAYDPVICVAATNQSDRKTGFSNFYPQVDISAPGASILSAVIYGNGYDQFDGTSMSSPIVAGACGLLRSIYPNLTPDQVKNCLTESADDIDDLNPAYIGRIGSGRLNVKKALECVLDVIDIDLGIVKLVTFPESYCSGNINPTVKVQNYRSTVITSIEFNYSFDDGLDNTYLWTGELQPNEIVDIEIELNGMIPASKNITITIHKVNNIQDEVQSNDRISAPFCDQSEDFEEEVKILPSLSTEMVQIQFDLQNPADIEIVMVNSNGSMMGNYQEGASHGGTYDFNIAGWPSGIYMIRVKAGEELTGKKFIIQR